MNRLHGRVIDRWRTTHGVAAVIADGDRFREVRVPEDVDIERGDLVRLVLGDDGRTEYLERLVRPTAAFDPAGDALRWRRPGADPSRMSRLRARSAVARAIREYLDAEGFLEVHAPLLVPGTCPDLHLHSIRAGDGYLVTSTEYQLKRLVAGGFDRVYSLAQNFRAGEVSDYHNPEFTMLEWARAYETLDAIEADVEALVERTLASVRPGEEGAVIRGRTVRLVGEPWERLTVREALRAHLGLDVDETFSAASLQDALARSNIRVPDTFLDDPHDTMSYLVDELGRHLGLRVPTFLREWPAFMTSSARIDPAHPTLAERSELFIGGMEIADGFPSLTDPAAQRALFAREIARRSDAGAEPVAPDDRYVAALEQGLPPGAGMALGFDRLVMVLTGARHIGDVLPFAWDER